MDGHYIGMNSPIDNTASSAAGDQLKQATAACVRSLANDASLQLVFGSEPANAPDVISLPMPVTLADPAERAWVRGLSDSEALRNAHHNVALHSHHAPPDALLRLLFDALERERFEALGRNAYTGVASNLACLWQRRHAPAAIAGFNASARLELALIHAFREALTGQPAAPHLRLFMDVQGFDVMGSVGALLPPLAQALPDQARFAELSQQLLQHLVAHSSLCDAAGEKASASDAQAGAVEDDAENANSDADDADDEKTGQADDTDERSSEAAVQFGEPEVVRDDALPEDSLDEAPLISFEFPQQDDCTAYAYRIYTTAFDETVSAESLAGVGELNVLRAQLDQFIAWHGQLVARLASRLQRVVLAQQRRHWDFDQEDGQLDTSRLTRVVTQPLSPLSFKVESAMPFRDTCITLLIDNSRSMLGRPIMMAAACADILARSLERCGVSVEILGFTTVELHDGRASRRWRDAGEPANPGRLNDVRHIIYKSADTPWRSARRNLSLMLHKDLLNQNIDGEALAWAHQRLARRAEQRKILMMISDGAPIDTSTLAANPASYLADHLREVIRDIEQQQAVELLAIGIGHDVSQYYRRAINLFDARQLGAVMLAELGALFEQVD